MIFEKVKSNEILIKIKKGDRILDKKIEGIRVFSQYFIGVLYYHFKILE